MKKCATPVVAKYQFPATLGNMTKGEEDGNLSLTIFSGGKLHKWGDLTIYYGESLTLVVFQGML